MEPFASKPEQSHMLLSALNIFTTHWLFFSSASLASTVLFQREAEKRLKQPNNQQNLNKAFTVSLRYGVGSTQVPRTSDTLSSNISTNTHSICHSFCPTRSFYIQLANTCYERHWGENGEPGRHDPCSQGVYKRVRESSIKPVIIQILNYNYNECEEIQDALGIFSREPSQLERAFGTIPRG